MATAKAEYDLYLPLSYEDGRPVGDETVQKVKKDLVEKHGGVTDFRHRNEGLWKVGGVIFRDEIIILRVLAEDGAEADKFFSELKTRLERQLAQTSILIVKRAVEIL